MQLTWVPSESPNIVGYSVLRGSAAGGPYASVTSTPVAGTTYLDTNVEAGQSYFYVVTAVDISHASSPYSNEAAAVVPSP